MGEELIWAIKNADLEKLRMISSQPGFDVNADLNHGKAIHIAADYGHPDVLEFLIKLGANVNVPDKYGNTPLLAAVYEGHADCVKILIEKGANKDGKTPDGMTYYEVAADKEVRDLLK